MVRAASGFTWIDWALIRVPILYLVVLILKRDRPYRVRKRLTWWVRRPLVDGFPRTGSTTMFFRLGGVELNAANHLHHPAALTLAKFLKVPMVISIRNPLDTLKSNLVYFPNAEPNTILKSYLLYYRTARACGCEFVHFDDIVKNDGLKVDVLKMTCHSVARAAELLHEHEQTQVAELGREIHRQTSLPSSEKNDLKAALSPRLKDLDQDLVADAVSLFKICCE